MGWYKVGGCFSVEVEAENHQEAKEIAQRILRFEGINFNIIDVQRRKDNETGKDSISGTEKAG